MLRPTLAPRPARPDLETVACYHCGADAGTPFLDAEDDLTGKPGRFHFVRCSGCGLYCETPGWNVGDIKAFYDNKSTPNKKKPGWVPLTPCKTRAGENPNRHKDQLVSRYLRLGPH